MTEEEWDLVPLDDIVRALSRRFDSYLVIGCTQDGAFSKDRREIGRNPGAEG